jgi:DNA-binding LacI/PurR family transcriptional regulator
MSSSPPRIRRAYRVEAVLTELRERIVFGEFAPGSRFPTQSEVMAQWGIGKATAQRIFHLLAAEGFIVPQGANGTFVGDAPPHLSQYGLVIPEHVTQLGYSRFRQGILREAMQLAALHACSIRSYYGPFYPPESAACQALLADMRAHRVSGIIFASDPGVFIGTPVVTETSVPCTAIMSETNSYTPAISAVYPDLDDFMVKAIAWLLQQSRRRIAHLALPRASKLTTAFRREVTAHGLATPPYWQLSVDVQSPASARNIVHCLLRLPPVERPDALVISDDNLVEEALAGVQAAGVAVPTELAVVAMANFPVLPEAPLPVHWLGVDLHAVLERCLANIYLTRRGGTPPARSRLPIVSEAEYRALQVSRMPRVLGGGSDHFP